MRISGGPLTITATTRDDAGAEVGGGEATTSVEPGRVVEVDVELLSQRLRAARRPGGAVREPGDAMVGGAADAASPEDGAGPAGQPGRDAGPAWTPRKL